MPFCKNCGSENVQLSPRDAQQVITFHHEVDVRHIPPVLSKEQAAALHDEALAEFSKKLRMHFEAHARKSGG
jgi:NifB/MoaA-like Fe-S oxidoreductase